MFTNLGAFFDQWTPKRIQSNVRQWCLDSENTYYSATKISDVNYLTPLETYTSLRAAETGRCWLFDGSNDIGATASRVTPSTNLAALTVAFRVKFTSLPANGSLIIAERAAGNTWWGVYYRSNLGVRLEMANTSAVEFQTTAVPVTTATWYNFVFTFDGTSMLGYLNGSQYGLATTFTGTCNPGSIPLLVGFQSGTLPILNGAIRDIRVYSVAKNSTFVTNYHNGDYTAPDTTNILAAWWCNERTGTVGYDWTGNLKNITLSNITASTFFSSDSTVLVNPSNTNGFFESGGNPIPAIPGTSNNSQNASGLTYTGTCPYLARVDTPCITGDGSAVYVDMGSPLFPASADFTCSFWYYHVTNNTTRKVVFGNGFHLSGNNTRQFYFIANSSNAVGSSGAAEIYNSGTARATIASALTAGAWHYVTIQRATNTFTLTVTPAGGTLKSASFTSNVNINDLRNTLALGFDAFSSVTTFTDGRICDIRVTTAGVTKTFPFQEGVGSSSTNRDVYWYGSNGTGGVLSAAIKNGTVSTIWANLCPGYVQDYSILNGSALAANGAIIPVNPVTNLGADGSVRVKDPGKFSNPYCRINFNPFSGAELNGFGVETAYVAGTARQTVAPVNSKFRRFATDGDDRLIITKQALTGEDLVNMNRYVNN